MPLIRLEPAYQNYVWGGSRIPLYFKRSLPAGRYAESWEVSDRDEGMSLIGSGPRKGKTLRDFFKSKTRFPLLVKVIDSKESLSIQVHPDEEAAHRLNAEPKTEMWVAIEKSTVYAGLKEGTTQEMFRRAIQTNRAEDLLLKYTLEKGESILIPAGCVHAIGAGAFILEIQQNSNTTYRLYDWGRMGRDLHLEKGLSCVKFDIGVTKKGEAKAGGGQILCENEYFIVESVTVDSHVEFAESLNYTFLFCLSGEAIGGEERILPGMTFLIPPNKEVHINGSARVILVKPA